MSPAERAMLDAQTRMLLVLARHIQSIRVTSFYEIQREIVSLEHFQQQLQVELDAGAQRIADRASGKTSLYDG